MRLVLAAGLAELGHLQPVLQNLLVLVGTVVDAVTGRAFQLDGIVLGHTGYISVFWPTLSGFGKAVQIRA